MLAPLLIEVERKGASKEVISRYFSSEKIPGIPYEELDFTTEDLRRKSLDSLLAMKHRYADVPAKKKLIDMVSPGLVSLLCARLTPFAACRL